MTYLYIAHIFLVNNIQCLVNNKSDRKHYVFTEVLYTNERIATELETNNVITDAIVNIFNRTADVSGNERIKSMFER